MAITQPNNRTRQAGMTLIEMVVVVSIVAVVSSVIIFNYSGFRSNVTLRGLSQEIALSVRKAQTYATSVQSIEGVSSSTRTFPAYGISFSIELDSSPDVATPSKKQFVLFADIDDGDPSHTGQYNSNGDCGRPEAGSECLESFSINSADKIVKICTDQGCQDSENLDIVFRRPAPDAAICMNSGGQCSGGPVSYVDVVVEGATGAQRTISVWNTGQISVQ